jgi:hypothetical protein
MMQTGEVQVGDRDGSLLSRQITHWMRMSSGILSFGRQPQSDGHDGIYELDHQARAA